MGQDSDKITAAGCSRQDCTGCEIQGKLLCIHTPKDPEDVKKVFFKNYQIFCHAWRKKERDSAKKLYEMD